MTCVAYLDCVGGISGDMLLGALLDGGASVDLLRAVPELLSLEGVEIEVEQVQRHGLSALHVSILEPGRVEARHAEDGRAFHELREVVSDSRLSPAVRIRSLAALDRLATAEARVHRSDRGEVHFHELDAADTLVDVCGAMLLLDELGVERIACSPLPYARGMIPSAHGVLPLPAPAVLELLVGAPMVGVASDAELVTPTGAAIVATVVNAWGGFPALTLERVGLGAGTQELADRPNVLRLVLGKSTSSVPLAPVSLLETNIDDLNPELVPDAVERCFEAGALDVWTVPAQMKKGRPGIVLSALARPSDEAAVSRAILEETSALGVRVSRLQRYELDREEREVLVEGHTVRVKVGLLDGRAVNVAPEHDDCVAAARVIGCAVKTVWTAALAAAHEL